MTATTSHAPRLQIDDTLGRRIVVIDKPVFRIGRRSESDVRPVSVDVSREHAEILRQDDGSFMLRDRGSRYGTFVNDEQVHERPLRHRDRIRLGRTGNAELIFLLEDSTELTANPPSGIVDFHQISSLLDRLRAMGSARVLDDVLELVMDSAIEATGAERGFIMLATPARALEFKIGRAKGGVSLTGTSFATSQKIPHEVFSTGREQMVVDLMEGPLAGDHLGTVALGIRNVLCAPLKAVRYLDKSEASTDHLPVGVLYLDSREKGKLLSAASRTALETVAMEATSAIESARLYRDAAEKARLENEMRLAAEIQRALLPAADESGPHFEVAAASTPCRAIGGDFFDYFRLPDGGFGFALGDVAGKGPPAALLTAMIQGVFSAQVTGAVSPAQLMASVNASLIRRSIQNRFATLVYGALAVDGRLTYSNAGHNPPVLMTSRGVQRLETGGLIVGLFPHAQYEQETVQLEDGDMLVVFSDGVTEAFDASGEDFGETRLLACLDEHRGCAPADLVQTLLANVRAFASGTAQHDDVTVLVLKYKRPQ